MSPGDGPPALTVLKDGKQFRFERRLADQRRRAGDIAETLRLGMFNSARPWHWHLPTNDDALDLLAQLSDQPIEDLIVQWPEGEKRSVSQVVQPAALRVQIESQQDWFGLNGTVEIDGQEVELAKILGAMRKGHRYVEVGPHQFVRLAQALRQSLEALDDVTHETKAGKLEFDITAAPVLKKMCDPSIELKTCLAWDESLARLERSEEMCPEPPITLAAELRRLPGRRLPLAAAAGRLGRGRLPGRRHGPGQNRADAGRADRPDGRRAGAGHRADQRRLQLATRSRSGSPPRCGRSCIAKPTATTCCKTWRPATW